MTAPVLLFIKHPQGPTTKRRLAMQLPSSVVEGAYRAFVSDMLSTLASVGCPLDLWYDPLVPLEQYQEWLGTRFRLLPQQGADLGARMSHAFATTFAQGAREAVLVGSDIPDLPASYLDQAFAALQEGDAVLGPAADGGFYLLGCRKAAFSPGLLDGVSWSTPRTFQDTTRALSHRGLSWTTLPEWYDIDTVEDLWAYLERNAVGTFKSSQTFSFLTSQLPWRVQP